MKKVDLSKAIGAYPTMITPYDQNGNVDYEAVEKLVEWYWQKGCDGLFASCQSSEIQCLDEDDRVKLAECVKRKVDSLAEKDSSRTPMIVVASGHVSDAFEDQVRELNRIAATGVDAVILITNRMDIENTNDENWIHDAERLIREIPENVLLGLYECPRPYKRLLTPKMLEWCLSTGRFRYIKDTCCDESEIERRLEILKDTPLRLFNANAQTLLESLKAGCAGYCGIMCNFHPELYVWLTHHYADQPETAEKVGAFLSMTAFTEALAYPITAKYHLTQIEKIPFSLYSRARDAKDFKPYDAMCIRQMNELASYVCESL